MEDSLTISQARAILLDLPERLARDKAAKSVTVTKRGKPVLAIVYWELYESLLSATPRHDITPGPSHARRKEDAGIRMSSRIRV